MAVLIEANSVVVRREAIDAKYPGGWEAFRAEVPNRTLCADAALARVGFMSFYDVPPFVQGLERRGLVFLDEGRAADIVIVDQQRGPGAPCDWITFQEGYVSPDGTGRVISAGAPGDPFEGFEEPEGWQYEGSLSQSFGYTPIEEGEKCLEFLRHEDGQDVYLSRLTGKVCYVARAGSDQPGRFS